MTVEPWTVQKVLQWSAGFLGERAIETPRLDAEVLLAHTLHCSRTQLYTHFDKPLSPEEREPYKALLKRRSAGEPVAYLTGAREFFGLNFAVSPAVLIPRPETEHLVEWAISFAKGSWRRPLAPGVDVIYEAFVDAGEPGSAKSGTDKPMAILDIGTGSGCIAITLAKKLSSSSVTAWDIDAAALSLAQSNATAHGATVTFEERNALADASWDAALPAFDLIVSNPPYIAPGDPDVAADVARYEPQHALYAGQDGLDFYRVFAANARQRLTPGGVLCAEIGSTQGPAVAALFRAAGWHEVIVRKDYAKLDRVVCARA